MNPIKWLAAWWNAPLWSKWFTVRLRCPRCDFSFADRRVREAETETRCSNCGLWHDSPLAALDQEG